MTFGTSDTKVCALSQPAGGVDGSGNGTGSTTVTITGAGACTFSADQAGTTTSLPASTVSRDLVVAQEVSVVTWPSPAAITYGTELSGAQLDATANTAGVFAYSVDDSPVSAGDPIVLAAGPHTLKVSFTPRDTTDYTTPAPMSVPLTVNPAPLTITANNLTTFYGRANPSFSVTPRGLVNRDTLASLQGTISFATQATQFSLPGQYAVTPSGLTSANYTITYAAGTLTIGKAGVTVVLGASPNPASFGQPGVLTVAVSAAAPGSGTPSGTVTFLDGGTPIGTGTLAGGKAALTTSVLLGGSHDHSISYSSDTNFTCGTSAVVPQSITFSRTVSGSVNGTQIVHAGETVLISGAVQGALTVQAGGIADGGGVFANGSLTVSNSTISNNTTTANGGVGGNGGLVFGGGIAAAGALVNTIVAGNIPSDCGFTVTDSGGNLDSDGSCGFSGPSSISHGTADLGPLQDNGGLLIGAPTGPTVNFTQALLPGSQAIGLGIASTCESLVGPDGVTRDTDDLGFPRHSAARLNVATGKGCDSGAYDTGDEITGPATIAGAIQFPTLPGHLAFFGSTNPGYNLGYITFQDGSNLLIASQPITVGCPDQCLGIGGRTLPNILMPNHTATLTLTGTVRSGRGSYAAARMVRVVFTITGGPWLTNGQVTTFMATSVNVLVAGVSQSGGVVNAPFLGLSKATFLPS